MALVPNVTNICHETVFAFYDRCHSLHPDRTAFKHTVIAKEQKLSQILSSSKILVK